MAVTAIHVRALEGSAQRHGVAGGAISMGDAGYIASDGDVEITDANVAVTSEFAGVVVAVGTPGATAAAEGDPITYVTFGPVGGFSSLTPGAKLYLGETAGALVHTPPSGAGTWTKVVGYAESASVAFIDPDIDDASSNS